MKVKLKDKKGNIIEVYPVDANEILASGQYTKVEEEVPASIITKQAEELGKTVLVNKETGETLKVYGVDAKEILASGEYEVLKVATAIENGQVEAQLPVQDEIDSMNGNALKSFMSKNDITIEGFSSLKTLVEKRQAVKDYLKEPKIVDQNVEDEVEVVEEFNDSETEEVITKDNLDI